MISMISCYAVTSWWVCPPARARRRARVFGYQVIMLIMFAVLQDTEGHQFIGIHDRLHDVPKEAAKRARILRKAMFEAGFSGVPDEW